MYQELYQTCEVVLLITPFFLRRCRCRCRRSFLKPPAITLKRLKSSQITKLGKDFKFSESVGINIILYLVLVKACASYVTHRCMTKKGYLYRDRDRESNQQPNRF